jgi:hypothetical protein
VRPVEARGVGVDVDSVTTPTGTDFNNHVAWLRREVAVPGTFDTVFPDTAAGDLAAALVDGFYTAKRQGWFPGIEADPDTSLTDAVLSMTAVGIVVLYAGINIVRNQIKEMNTVFRAASGKEQFETQKAPSVLTERLKEMEDERKELLLQAQNSVRGRRPVFMHDGYAIRLQTMYRPELPSFSRVVAADELV